MEGSADIGGFNGDPAMSTIPAYFTVDQGEQSMIAAHPYEFARMNFSATLADENVSGENFLTGILFDAEPLAGAVASVFGGALTFFMCHNGKRL